MSNFIKKYWAIAFLIFAIVFFVYKKISTKKIDSQIFKTPTGWGYNITNNGKIKIHQNLIPAVAGMQSFATKEQAKTVANYIIATLQQHPTSFPIVTLEILDSLQITYIKK
jgi:Domain of unknown function (DUF4907)